MKGNLIMTPENHQAFERTLDMLDNSINEIRRVAHRMMPEILVRSGLDAALNDYCNDINESGVIQIQYQSVGLENETYDQKTAITIYRIALELITNTIKHATASTAIVRLTKSNGRLTLGVEDDGRGFDTSILTRRMGQGWTNIKDRVEALDGKLEVNSVAGKGTSVHIELNF